MAFWWDEARTLSKHPRRSQQVGLCLQALTSSCLLYDQQCLCSILFGSPQAHPPAGLHLRVVLPSAWDMYRKKKRLVLIFHTSPSYPCRHTVLIIRYFGRFATLHTYVAALQNTALYYRIANVDDPISCHLWRELPLKKARKSVWL